MFMSEEKEGYIIDYISGKEVRETPEEIQAVQPYAKKLVEDYGYPVENIMVHPQYRVKVRPSDTKKEYPVDIAVFSDKDHIDDDCYLNFAIKQNNSTLCHVQKQKKHLPHFPYDRILLLLSDNK